MKMIIKSVLVAGVAGLAVTTMLGKGGGGGGQAVHTIRFVYKVVFTNTGADANIPNATGSAKASESINNGKDQESLNISFKGLEASSPYSLLGTTTTSGSTDAADFTTDKNGNAKVSLSTKSGKKGFPIGSLAPLHQVTELDVVDASSNIVLTADTTTPQTFTFKDKLSATGPNGETGTISVSASDKSAKLNVKASGLTASDSLSLTLTGGTLTSSNNTFTASSSGTVNINATISENVLDLTEVDLDDTTAGTTVLVFPLP